MLFFNTLLAEVGLDPKDVRMVRHQDHRENVTPYTLWRASDGRFEFYQASQGRDRFKSRYVASFIAPPNNETLFVGLYEKTSQGIVPPGTAKRSDYLVSVLEVAASSAGSEDIIVMETRWKDKLLSRKFGLNEN